MKKINSNNALLKFYDDHVKKILRKGASTEKITRFKKECRVLDQLRGKGISNTVYVIEISHNDNPPWYK